MKQTTFKKRMPMFWAWLFLAIGFFLSFYAEFRFLWIFVLAFFVLGFLFFLRAKQAFFSVFSISWWLFFAFALGTLFYFVFQDAFAISKAQYTPAKHYWEKIQQEKRKDWQYMKKKYKEFKHHGKYP